MNTVKYGRIEKITKNGPNSLVIVELGKCDIIEFTFDQRINLLLKEGQEVKLIFHQQADETLIEIVPVHTKPPIKADMR